MSLLTKLSRQIITIFVHFTTWKNLIFLPKTKYSLNLRVIGLKRSKEINCFWILNNHARTDSRLSSVCVTIFCWCRMLLFVFVQQNDIFAVFITVLLSIDEIKMKIVVRMCYVFCFMRIALWCVFQSHRVVYISFANLKLFSELLLTISKK